MIENWREIVLEAPGFHIGVWGLLIGLIFGYVIFRTNYCSMGAISDIENFGDFRRFRAWVLAAAVAMIGVWFFAIKRNLQRHFIDFTLPPTSTF